MLLGSSPTVAENSLYPHLTDPEHIEHFYFRFNDPGGFPEQSEGSASRVNILRSGYESIGFVVDWGLAPTRNDWISVWPHHHWDDTLYGIRFEGFNNQFAGFNPTHNKAYFVYGSVSDATPNFENPIAPKPYPMHPDELPADFGWNLERDQLFCYPNGCEFDIWDPSESNGVVGNYPEQTVYQRLISLNTTYEARYSRQWSASGDFTAAQVNQRGRFKVRYGVDEVETLFPGGAFTGVPSATGPHTTLVEVVEFTASELENAYGSDYGRYDFDSTTITWRVPNFGVVQKKHFDSAHMYGIERCGLFNPNADPLTTIEDLDFCESAEAFREATLREEFYRVGSGQPTNARSLEWTESDVIVAWGQSDDNIEETVEEESAEENPQDELDEVPPVEKRATAFFKNLLNTLLSRRTRAD